MTFELKTVDELARIAHAGGGFTLDARLRSTDDLARIAAAASHVGARITLKGIAGLRSVDDLARIAHAGKGSISFED